MRWLQDTNRSTADNLNNVRRGNIRHIRNKKKEYMQAIIDEFEIHSKIKQLWDLYRSIKDSKKVYQPRTNI
jgi:hypothetical protein